MNDEYIRMHRNCFEAVYANDYYINLFEEIIHNSGYIYPCNLLEEPNSSHICSFWNDFWFALPDNAAIRRPPFFSICEMAEYDYREPIEDEPENVGDGC